MILIKKRIPWKKLLGASLIASPFVAIFIVFAMQIGILSTLGIYALAVLIVVIIKAGESLFSEKTEDENKQEST